MSTVPLLFKNFFKHHVAPLLSRHAMYCMTSCCYYLTSPETNFNLPEMDFTMPKTDFTSPETDFTFSISKKMIKIN